MFRRSGDLEFIPGVASANLSCSESVVNLYNTDRLSAWRCSDQCDKQ